MRKNTNETKKNVFGTADFTPGQNLVNSLNGFKSYHPFGILECNYKKIEKIFDSALNEEEKDFLNRGFGFGRPRQKQNEIAAELGLDPNYVSKVSREAIEVKLQKSPYKGQLKALVPTMEDVNRLVAKGMARDDSEKLLGEYKYRLDASKSSIAAAEKAKEKAEDALARKEHEVQMMKIQLKKLETSRAIATERILELEAEINGLKNTNEVARRRMRAAYDKLESVIFDSISDTSNKPATTGIEELGLSDEAKNALSKAGIKDLNTLCNMGQHTLTKMGLGQKNISEIKEALKKKGLSLKK